MVNLTLECIEELSFTPRDYQTDAAKSILKSIIEEQTDFNSMSLKSGIETILKLKQISRMIEEINRLHVKESSLNKKQEFLENKVKSHQKAQKGIFAQYFNPGQKYSPSDLNKNLKFILIQKEVMRLESDIKEEQLRRNKLKFDLEGIYETFHAPLSEDVKNAYEIYLKDSFEDRILLFSLSRKQKKINEVYGQIDELKQTLLEMPSHYELQESIQELKEDKIATSRTIFENYWLTKIKNLDIVDEEQVSRYFDVAEKLERYIQDKSLWRNLITEQESSLETIQSFLPIWVVTNLSVKNSLPLLPNIFDILVIDEASQCDIASAIPLLYRAKQVVIIGDPKQLKHISQLNDSEDQDLAVENDCKELYTDYYSYSKNSIYDLAESVVRSEGIRPILLNQHYRSHKDIINFSNEYFYDKKLNIMTDEKKLVPKIVYPRGITWIDVKGKTSLTKSPYNLDECKETLKLLKSYSESNLSNVSFGVVTLFRAQTERILGLIERTNELKSMDITVGTAHRFQGDEKDIIIFSPCVSVGIRQTTLNWIKTTSQLINVAITRARSSLIIVGDKTKCEEAGGVLKHLVDYSGMKSQDIIFDSPIEHELYSKLINEGIKVDPQHSVKIEGSKLYRLDFALFVENRKFDIEIDGAKAHSGKIEADLLRDAHMRMDGWQVKRFLAEEVQNNIDGVVEEIKRLC